MIIYAIDPGTEQSAVVTLKADGVTGAILPNTEVLAWLAWAYEGQHLVIEQIECYGMAVGREVFETVFWAGRFAQVWDSTPEGTWSMLPRRDVKLTLCGSMKAKDANIRTALIDRYGGKAATKKGGPLYGVKSHMWSALALAVTYTEQQKARVA